MDCTAVAARHTVAGCRKDESSIGDQGMHLDADTLQPLQYHKTSNAVEMTDSGNLYIADPVVYWNWALAYNHCSAPLHHSCLRQDFRHPQDQSSAFSALMRFRPVFVNLVQSGNGFVDLGPTSCRGKPWWLGDNSRCVEAVTNCGSWGS